MFGTPISSADSVEVTEHSKDRVVCRFLRQGRVENDILPQWQAMDETERNRLVNVPLVDAADPYTIHPVVK